MPPAKPENTKNQQQPKERKQRTGFNVKKDIILLKSALQQNPWQLGDDKWNDVVADCNKSYDVTVVVRTVKNRLDLLLEKYNAQLLTTLTGTEEERSERGDLLQEITEIIEEEKAKINVNIGADEIKDIVFFEDEVFQAINISEEPKRKRGDVETKRERVEADHERDRLLNSEAPSPIVSRKKRKICLEDEMILERQQHEMEMEKERLKLERDKLLLEEKREDRVREEGRRRDELAASQVQIQSQLLHVLTKFIEK